MCDHNIYPVKTMMSKPTFYSAPFSIASPSKEEIHGMSLRFDDIPISRGIFRRFMNACLDDISFGEITGAELHELMKKAGVEGKMDIMQAQSIRRHSIRQYNITNTFRVQNSIADIARDYEGGRGLLEISARLRLSPFIIFRHLMNHLEEVGARSGMRNKLELLSLGRVRPEDVLTPRDAEQYLAVREFDFESVSVQMKIAEISGRKEANFIAFLRDDLGIQLKTQEQLFAEATREGVRPVTPDALFLSPVEINGRPARWIDFKSYCGSPVPFLARSTAAQCKKYEATYGPGFMVYEYGFVEPAICPSVSARALQDIIDNGTKHAILV